MRNHRHSRQGGAALVIGLILLTVITLLAVVGMNISNTELASATSEQMRLRAFQASETGIEYAMSRTTIKKDVFSAGTKCGAVIITPVTVVDGSPINSATGLPTDRYTTRISYIDEGASPDGYSQNTFRANHYVVESQGSSSRNAVDTHKLGTYLVNQSGNQGSFRPSGSDCYIPLAPNW